VGPSAASAKPIVVKEVFEAVRMFSPGRFLIHLPKLTEGRAALRSARPAGRSSAARASHFRPAQSLGRHIA